MFALESVLKVFLGKGGIVKFADIKTKTDTLIVPFCTGDEGLIIVGFWLSFSSKNEVIYYFGREF